MSAECRRDDYLTACAGISAYFQLTLIIDTVFIVPFGHWRSNDILFSRRYAERNYAEHAENHDKAQQHT